MSIFYYLVRLAVDDQDNGGTSYQGDKLIVLEVELVINFHFGVH